METYYPRKERHKNNISIKVPFHSSLNLFGISSLIIILIQTPDPKNLIIGAIIVLPFIFSRYIHLNFFTLAILFFTIIPLEISLLIIVFLDSFFNNMLMNILTLVIFPLVTISMLLIYSKNRMFLKKAKVSLEFLNFVLVTTSLILVLVAYQKSEFEFLSTFFDINKNQKLGYKPIDMFNFFTSYFLFPFFVSNLFCKFILEFIFFRNEKNVYLK